MTKDVYVTSCKVPVILVAHLVEALRYKPEGRGFDFRCRPQCGRGVDSACKGNEHQEYLLGVKATGE